MDDVTSCCLSFLLLVILGVLSLTRRKQLKVPLFAQTVALFYLGTLSPIEALPVKKTQSSSTASLFAGSMVIAYLLMKCVTFGAGGDDTGEVYTLPQDVREQAPAEDLPNETYEDNASLEHESVEKLASILDASDDEGNEINEEVHEERQTPLIIEKTATDPLIMITWNRYVWNVRVIATVTNKIFHLDTKQGKRQQMVWVTGTSLLFMKVTLTLIVEATEIRLGYTLLAMAAKEEVSYCNNTYKNFH